MASKASRKIIVGTTVFGLWDTMRPYTTLDNRLSEIAKRLDEMSGEAQKNYGRGLDIAVFPENSLNRLSSPKRTLKERSVVFDETLKKTLGEMAKTHNTWLIVSGNIREQEDADVYNVALLFDRTGTLSGIYRKVYTIADVDGKAVEGGKIPGTEFPVFETEFGKIAMLVCFDMGYDDLMEAYAKQGAEIVFWPSMSPQTFIPRCYARRLGFYVVSSTPRKPAVVIDPLGEFVARLDTEGALVSEIALDYRLIPWQHHLNNGEILTERYGEGVGFRYYNDEDTGIFWSNNPEISIDQMMEETELLTNDALREKTRVVREKILKEKK